MSVTYKKAPLVELIAEVRWEGSGVPLPIVQQNQPRILLPHPWEETLFESFGNVISQKGYTRLERLIPPGMPAPVNVPACRFRPADSQQPSPLFQVGRGIFTANALPPNYQSWKAFCPVVKFGLSSLFEAYSTTKQPLPDINEILIRYIDIFSGEILSGKDLNEFMADILGIKLSLPIGITSITKAGATIQQTIQLQQQVDIGLLNISIGPAMKEGQKGLMLDSSLLIQRQIGSELDGTIDALTEARGVIHELFRKLTEPLHQLMEPTQ